MFKILDGREEFYQWDVDRKLIISDTTVDEVHFCNRTDDCSLVVKVYELDGQRVADVPNILLQTDWPVRVYAYCGGSYTKQMATYKVRSRTKPADYVYTETEVLNYSTLLERIEELEEKEVEVDLTDYVKNTDYATKNTAGVIKIRSYYGTGVNAETGEIFVVGAEEADIDEGVNKHKPITPRNLEYAVKSVGDGYYATEAQLAEVDGVKEVYVGGETPPEGVGLIWIDSSKTAPDYATKEYVDNVVAASGGSDVDLSDYYTKDETDKALNDLDMTISNWAWAELENKADKTELDNYVKDTDLVDATVAYAEEANNATNAIYSAMAEFADYALGADYAVSAEKDSSDNVITETYATKAELAAIGGGAGGGSKTYTFDFNVSNIGNTITDKDKTVLQEIKATGSKMDYDLYVSDGINIVKITKINFGTSNITLYPNEVIASIELIQFAFNNDGTYKHCAINYGDSSDNKTWKWQDNSDAWFYVGSYSHVKIVGYWDGNSNELAVYDISTSNNNTFEQEYYTKYWVSKQYGANAENVYFYNDGGRVNLQDVNGNDFASSGSFTPVGFYYWG